VLLQFEDFAQQNANLLLQKYRQQLCMFNDDIQGTAAVAVAALIAAVNATETELKDQRVVVFGAGSAGCGISEQLIRVLVQQGLSEAAARSLFFMVDRQGLLHDGMTGLLEFQKNLLQPYAKVKTWAAKDKEIISLLDVIQQAKPTILLGVSGIPNQFTKEIIEAMQANCQRPIIFPMSNPTSRSEANPADLIHWTNGQALIATGSPFPDVVYNKKTYAIAQCNNCYIFPGMGLGVMISAAKRITDAMFMQATMTLSEQAAALSTKGSALLPSLENIRQVSDKIAYAVAKQAMREGVAETISDDELKEAINKNKWVPGYQPMRLSNVNGNAG
jgi:malate dehydrogenase (oxaloacetate-decarboxylating)